MKPIILASQSPRRVELLTLAGISCRQVPSQCEECGNRNNPAELVCDLSAQKANDVAERIRKEEKTDALVIGADTIVYHNGNVLEKPKDEADALRMLKELSGQTHSVFTGVTVVDLLSGKQETFYEETKVTFFSVSDADLRAYIATKEPMDKAGSYGVQGYGAFLVKRIEGDYFTVVGLPVARLVRVLSEMSGDTVLTFGTK